MGQVVEESAKMAGREDAERAMMAYLDDQRIWPWSSEESGGWRREWRGRREGRVI